MKTSHRISLLALGLAASLGVSCAQAVERSWSYTYNSLGLIETANGPRTDVQDVTTYGYDAQCPWPCHSDVQLRHLWQSAESDRRQWRTNQPHLYTARLVGLSQYRRQHNQF